MATKNNGVLRVEISAAFTNYTDMYAVLNDIRQQLYKASRARKKGLFTMDIARLSSGSASATSTVSLAGFEEPLELPAHGAESGVFAWEALGWEIKEINGVKCATKRSKI